MPTASRDRPEPPRRVVLVPGGPMLVDGPVELVLDDGTTVVSDRFVVAVCACRRSKRYPFCDTSHRRRVRSGPSDPGRGSPDPTGGDQDGSGRSGPDESGSG